MSSFVKMMCMAFCAFLISYPKWKMIKMSTITLREIIRLILNTHYSNREIARLVSSSHTTVSRYRKLIRLLKVKWKELKKFSDSELEALFEDKKPQESSKRMPDYALVHKLMTAKYQTLIQLWTEYREVNPGDAYCYAQFTYYYRRFLEKVDVSMKLHHIAGEECFIDYAGKTIQWAASSTKQKQHAQIFISVLGCSQYIFAHASPSQKLEDWIDSHNKMFLFYGGVPEVLIPDNLKSAVTKAGRFPEINKTYAEMAEHYECFIDPARVRKPQDKALAEQWITVVLNRRQFFSIDEINHEIQILLDKLNRRAFRRLPGCRLSRFEELDKPKLKPLPQQPFEHAIWFAPRKVGSDYHMLVEGHAYSVPYTLSGQKVEARMTKKVVELFHEHKRIAIHVRSHAKEGFTTDPAHRPASHQAYAERSKEFYVAWAIAIGEHVVALVKAQFTSKTDYSSVAKRACDQLQRLAKKFGPERTEAACRKASEIESLTVSSVRSILQRRLDLPCGENDYQEDLIPMQEGLPVHTNVRGASYYGGASC